VSGEATRKLKTYLGSVVRDIEGKVIRKDAELQELLMHANRLLAQQRTDKSKL